MIPVLLKKLVPWKLNIKNVEKEGVLGYDNLPTSDDRKSTGNSKLGHLI